MCDPDFIQSCIAGLCLSHAQCRSRATGNLHSSSEPLIGKVLARSHDAKGRGISRINHLRHGLCFNYLGLPHRHHGGETFKRAAFIGHLDPIETAVARQELCEGEFRGDSA